MAEKKEDAERNVAEVILKEMQKAKDNKISTVRVASICEKEGVSAITVRSYIKPYVDVTLGVGDGDTLKLNSDGLEFVGSGCWSGKEMAERQQAMMLERKRKRDNLITIISVAAAVIVAVATIVALFLRSP